MNLYCHKAQIFHITINFYIFMLSSVWLVTIVLKFHLFVAASMLKCLLIEKIQKMITEHEYLFTKTSDKSNKTVEIPWNDALHTATSIGDKNTLKRLLDSTTSKHLESKDSLGRTPLILSVIHGHIECTVLLLKSGARVDNSDNTGQTALHIAVNKGFHRCVKLLLSHSAAWDQKDFSGVTSLHLAAIYPSPKCLLLILKKLRPGEIDVQDSSKKTALHWSSAYSNAEHVTILLNQEANICIPDEEGKTSLHWAATNCDTGALKCVKLLLEKEPRVIDWQDYEGRSALHLAVASGGVEMVNYLASRDNCNIDILDNMFCTPLHWAAKRGLIDEVDILLKKGACYSSADGNGATPLHYAAHHNHAETMKVFLSRNYISDEPDNDGRNSFMWAAARNATDVMSVMLAYCSDLLHVFLGYRDKNGATALHAAAIQGHVSAIEFLLGSETRIDAVDNKAMTPLLRACELGRTKAAQVLVDRGASVFHTDVNSRSCLHWSALGGHAYLCQILLQQSCELNSQDKFGLTPLHYASLNGYINCVSVLLESKADTDVNDNEGKTPLHWAVLNDKLGVVKLLCEYEANINSMALLEGWVTPLDCAVMKDYSEIILLLKKYKALTSCEIENIAAAKIQSWYRDIRRRRKPESNEICVNGYDFKNSFHIYSLSSSSASESLKYSFKSDTSKFGQSITASKSKSKIPVAKWRMDTHYSNWLMEQHRSLSTFCFQSSSLSHNNAEENIFLEENAAVVIQKAWRRHIMKKRFQRIRSKVNQIFTSDKKRLAAERDWKTKFNNFLDEL